MWKILLYFFAGIGIAMTIIAIENVLIHLIQKCW